MKHLSLNNHCAKFDAYGSCGSRHITFLLFKVTSRDHIIKGTYHLVSGSRVSSVTTLTSLALVGLSEVEM